MILQIFIEIGSYFTDIEQKASWHSFFWDTVYYGKTMHVTLIWVRHDYHRIKGKDFVASDVYCAVSTSCMTCLRGRVVNTPGRHVQ